MKVVQTLGTSKEDREGVCRYAHLSDKIIIDLSINDYLEGKLQKIIEISTAEWALIVKAVELKESTTLRITPADPPDSTSLHEIIEGATSKTGISGHDSMLACIVAILEHEGVIDLAHTPGHPIQLRYTKLPKTTP